jgi:hypothetical protein
LIVLNLNILKSSKCLKSNINEGCENKYRPTRGGVKEMERNVLGLKIRDNNDGPAELKRLCLNE